MAVADLIEVCFENTLDEDGREYLRQMRWSARDMTHLSWLQGSAERIAMPLFGFVWEEHGRIVGNLSLIPMLRGGRPTYLIANVAVHPDYRRQGIGQQLTQTAIDHLRERRVHTAWLQVRDDNPVAYHLYRSLGFVEQARRSAWQSSGVPRMHHALSHGISIRRRSMQDWDQHSEWLREVYPPELSWNMPINIGSFSPAPLRLLMRWLRGESQEHWAAWRGEYPIGFVSWEPMRASSDPLWLATQPEYEDEAIFSLLPYARAMLAGKGKPLSVNYPAGRGDEAFRQAGFVNFQTLVWMSIEINPS